MRRLATFLLALGLAVPAFAQAPPAIAERTAGLTRVEGFVPYYWDDSTGHLLLEISRFDEDILYYTLMSKGIGSMALGVDRGGPIDSAVIHFKRVGPRVIVEQQNLAFRAPNGNDSLQRGMEQSFASSILAALPIEAADGDVVLVDATPLLIRDAPGLEGQLREDDQGSYSLDPDRSVINLERTEGFPENTELDVTLTYETDQAGPLVEDVTPDPRSLTVGVRHSFVQPPDDEYRPRVGNPQMAVGTVSFKDYSKPYSEGTEVEWIRRWRLEKQDPSAAVSEPVEPISIYLDSGIPEPIRSAIREGILWWNRAFEAAGFRNAIEVLDPGPEIDPADMRYSYVLWVNRDERGFSNGGGFSDPRTGEMVAMKPRLDSHRIRTMSNYWSAYGPASTSAAGAGRDEVLDCGMTLMDEAAWAVAAADDMLRAKAAANGQTLAAAQNTEEDFVRARQALLAAHEVGHSLGFGHNWSSSVNDRGSVMDYPTPRLTVTEDGRIDLSDSFQRDIGAYDVMAVRYSYTPFAPEDEAAGLAAIVRETREKGLLYTPSTDPRWSRYDDRASPAEYLRETIAVRRVLLDEYGPEVLQAGEPMGALRNMRLWMTYLHHRWAIDTGVPYIGGMYDNYSVQGETTPATEIVPAALQREVLDLLMSTITPEALAIPEPLLAQLGSVPSGPDIEEFNSATGAAFDHLSAARTLTAMVTEQLLDPERAARLVSFADRQADGLTLPELLETMITATWGAPDAAEGTLRSLQRVSRRVVLDSMMILGASPQATPEVRAVVLQRIAQLGEEIPTTDTDPIAAAMQAQAKADIIRYMEDPAAYAPSSSALPQPAGAPLGGRVP